MKIERHDFLFFREERDSRKSLKPSTRDAIDYHYSSTFNRKIETVTKMSNLRILMHVKKWLHLKKMQDTVYVNCIDYN